MGRPKRSIATMPTHRSRFRRRVPQITSQKVRTHRRFAAYPSVAGKTDWLSSLWKSLQFWGSIALKLSSLIVSINDDFSAGTYTTFCSVAIAIGPEDFAANSSYCRKSKDALAKTGRVVVPFERIRLHRYNFRFVPSVDLSKRGGTYAVACVPVDPLSIVDDASTVRLLENYDVTFEQVCQYNGAKIARTDREIRLSVVPTGVAKTPRAIGTTTIIEDGTTYAVNDNPTHVLMIAYSDLASSDADIKDAYLPAHGLFEIHSTCDYELCDPAYGLDEDSATRYVSRFPNCRFFTNSKNNGYWFDGQQRLAPRDEKFSLLKCDFQFSRHATKTLRPSVLDELAAAHPGGFDLME